MKAGTRHTVFFQGRPRSRGQSVVEFALIMPIIMILIMACVEFGVLINNHMSIANAAREGARAGALGRPLSEINARIIKSSGLLTIASTNITSQKSSDNGVTWTALGPAITEDTEEETYSSTSTKNDATVGQLIRITITIQHQQLTNFIPGLNAHIITKNVVMRREQT